MGYRFQAENINEVLDRIKAVQQESRRALVKFKHEQNQGDAALIEEAALCDLLNGGIAEKALLRMVRAKEEAAGVVLEEEDNTV